jgi:hypothetical protein
MCFYIQYAEQASSSFMYFKCVSIILQLFVYCKMLTVRSICMTVKADGLDKVCNLLSCIILAFIVNVLLSQ